jgi:hypothetical protein
MDLVTACAYSGRVFVCVNYMHSLPSCSRPVHILFACLKNRFPIFNSSVHGHLTIDQMQPDPDFVVSCHTAFDALKCLKLQLTRLIRAHQ